MMDVAGAMAVERGCGFREENGVYFETGLSPFGRPLEEFMFDPVIEIPYGFTVPERGMTLLEWGGTWHVVNRVGAESYPSPLDFLEEGRRFGFSGRVQHTFEWEKLEYGKSRILHCHPRAKLLSRIEYLDAVHARVGELVCPTHRLVHEQSAKIRELECVAMWRHDIDRKEGRTFEIGDVEGHVLVKMPSFSYEAWLRPEGVKPKYELAFMVGLPISRIAVVQGDLSAERAKKISDACAFPVAEVEA
jgi:hypothetical protein